MSEAACPKLWGLNRAPWLLPAAYRYRSLTRETDSGDREGIFFNGD
jgi:hypothetical protein